MENNSEKQIGSIQNGPIYDKLKKMGLTHEDYKIQWPEKDKNDLIGMGAENYVYKNGNKVEKLPHAGNSTSFIFKNGKLNTIIRTDLDKLIHQYEKVLSIRVFNCVVNSYHSKFLYMNPDKKQEIPLIQSLNSIVDKQATIHEDLVQDTSNPVTKIETEIVKFVPKIIKQMYFYFDTRGGVQAYKNGYYNGQPVYNVLDGVKVFKPSNDTQKEIEKHKHKFSRYDTIEKTSERIEKFKKIIYECSEEQLKIMLNEIEKTFNLNFQSI